MAMQNGTLALFASLAFATMAYAADSTSPEEQLAAVVDDALQARMSITSLFHFTGKLPAVRDIYQLTEESAWTDMIRWTGEDVWVVSKPMASGQAISIYLTPTLVTGNRLDWTCRSLGGGTAFPYDCTSEINRIFQRDYPQSRATASSQDNSPSNIGNRATMPVIEEFLQESMRLMTWISDYISINGTLPAVGEIGFPQSLSTTVDTIRWNGREVWVQAVTAVLGAELVLVLTPVFEDQRNRAVQDVLWNCRSIGRLPDFPTDCTSRLDQ